MCLTSVDPFVPDDYTNGGIGWKSVEKKPDGRYVSPFHDYEFAAAGTANAAESTQEWTGDNKRYDTGFHIFLNLDDAFIYTKQLAGTLSHTPYVTVRVSFENPLCFGYEKRVERGNVPVIVAEKMTILAEESDVKDLR